jgi:carbonic anhydrase/acetyltransferase-like protein (isoleucine patch superfamily)
VAIYALGDLEPDIDPTAWVHPDATVIGNVTLGADVTVWPHAVLRGDYSRIVVGDRTNVQDGAVIHAPGHLDTVIGSGVVIGHLAHMEGCTIGDGVLIGSGSILLHDVVVGDGAIIGGAALVPNGTHVPPGAMALGVPVKIREGAAPEGHAAPAAEQYARNGARFRRDLRRLD